MSFDDRPSFPGALPCSFGSLVHLSYLDLSANRLSLIPDCSLVGMANSLVWLNVAGNAIVYIPRLPMVSARRIYASFSAFGVPFNSHFSNSWICLQIKFLGSSHLSVPFRI